MKSHRLIDPRSIFIYSLIKCILLQPNSCAGRKGEAGRRREGHMGEAIWFQKSKTGEPGAIFLVVSISKMSITGLFQYASDQCLWCVRSGSLLSATQGSSLKTSSLKWTYGTDKTENSGPVLCAKGGAVKERCQKTNQNSTGLKTMLHSDRGSVGRDIASMAKC